MREVNKVWEDFWKPMVTVHGELDMSKIKSELYDYYMLMGRVTKVYNAVTNGRITSLDATPESIIMEMDAYVDRLVGDYYD